MPGIQLPHARGVKEAAMCRSAASLRSNVRPAGALTISAYMVPSCSRGQASQSPRHFYLLKYVLDLHGAGHPVSHQANARHESNECFLEVQLCTH